MMKADQVVMILVGVATLFLYDRFQNVWILVAAFSGLAIYVLHLIADVMKDVYSRINELEKNQEIVEVNHESRLQDLESTKNTRNSS